MFEPGRYAASRRLLNLAYKARCPLQCTAILKSEPVTGLTEGLHLCRSTFREGPRQLPGMQFQGDLHVLNQRTSNSLSPNNAALCYFFVIAVQWPATLLFWQSQELVEVA